MGVDIQTYRCRIGSFGSIAGRLSKVSRCSALGNIIFIAGALSFIGMLLFMEGIELNPGPTVSGKWKDNVIKPRDIVFIAECIGGLGVQSLGLGLSFSKAVIEHIQMDNKRSIDQIASILHKWMDRMNREGDEATFSKLFAILQDIPRLTVNWETLEERYAEAKSQVNFKDDMKTILSQLNLSDQFPEKISIFTALEVDTETEKNEDNNLMKSPWILLKKILSTDCNARDAIPNQLSKLEDKDTLVLDLDTFFEEAPQTTEDGGSVCRLDIFWALYHCCDPILRQIIVRKLYLCNLAVPFLSMDYGSKLVKAFIWPLRHLSLSFDESTQFDKHALDTESHVVTFCRLGRPMLSKSRLLNRILSGEETKLTFPVFYNPSCQSEHVDTSISNGTVDMFWLHPCKANSFELITTFLNMRGDLAEDFIPGYLKLTNNLTDVFVVVVDIDDLKTNFEPYGNILKRFSFVVIVISGLVYKNVGTLNLFKSLYEQFKESNSHVKFIRTNNGDQLSKQEDIVKSILGVILVRLRDHRGISIQDRIDRSGSKSLFVETIYQLEYDNGKVLAGNVVDQMEKDILAWKNKNGIPSDTGMTHCKESITPCSLKNSSQLSRLIKSLELTRSSEESDAIQNEILFVRNKQLEDATKSVSTFACSLCECNSTMERQFFIFCLKLEIENRLRAVLLEMQETKQNEQEYLGRLRTSNAPEFQIKEQKSKLTDVEKYIENTLFDVEFLFREIGHICDSCIYLGVDTTYCGLPNIEKITEAFADLVLHGGNSLELIDGDNFYMPIHWIIGVFTCIHKKLNEKSKLFTISLLGLQSSGKSTLLNTMFGVHFSVSSGRCTRGIHAQLLPVRNGLNKQCPLNLIMVIDSEGLRAPELFSVLQSDNRDNEMATFVTGLGNISVMNVMGEHMSDLRDILQIVVNALLRLNEANDALPKDQSCFFVHQNVSEPSARQKMTGGFERFVECLDLVTEEAAKQEGLKFKHFNDVIKFDIETNVRFIPCLWQGSSNLKHINPDYSTVVVGVRNDLIKTALSVKCSKTLDDFGIQASDLWKGIMSENFVFSFRNRLEIKAYCTIMEQINRSLWEEELSLRIHLMNVSQNKLALCEDESKVESDKRDIEQKFTQEVKDFTTNCLNKSEKIVVESEYSQIALKWKNDINLHVTQRSREIRVSLSNELDVRCNLKVIELSTSRLTKEKRDMLKSEASNVAKDLREKEKDIEPTIVKQSFDKIWTKYEKEICSQATSSLTVDFDELSETYLYEYFKNDIQILKKELKHKTNVCHLQNSFGLSKITINDINIDSENSSEKEKIFQDIVSSVRLLFQNVEEDLQYICTTTKCVNKIDFMSFCNNFDQRTVDMTSKVQSQNAALKKSFFIKLFMHTLSFVSYAFCTQNKHFDSQYGMSAHLKRFKSELKILFCEDVANRKADHKAAELFCLGVSNSIKKTVLRRLPLRMENIFKKGLPYSKHNLMKTIYKTLAISENLPGFVRYLEKPKTFSARWVKHKWDDMVADKEFALLQAKQEIQSMTEEIIKGLKDCFVVCLDQNKTSMSMRFLFLTINRYLRCRGISLDKIEFETFLSLTRIEDFFFFTMILLGQRGEMGLLEHKLSATLVEFEVKYLLIPNPYLKVFNEIWGCDEQCPFCLEPCARTENHPDSPHYCIQHRPKGCRGIMDVHSRKISKETCNGSITLNTSYMCSVIRKKCGCENETPHPYSEYQRHFQRWDIAPSLNNFENAKFWLWFIGYFKKDLAKMYGCDVSEVPSWWTMIKKSVAIASLDDVY
ncbi:interferon-induced very large GTPase 1-like [Mya arenaria]|uniref:interferon-induced very large GTPase 1-like n=1 Tax=Mya arenaria TaxID=6604 RepID=UPI0022E6184E|nr:interferon-induced very large GTPase 1-like [Mya arenaria]